MTRRARRVTIIALMTIALMTILGALFRGSSGRPANIGVRDGALAPCPATPNCVSTRASAPGQRAAPLAFTGPATDALARLRRVVSAMPGARVVVAEERYLHAEFTSRVLRFVDDVEFLVDAENGVIHYRSASRLGRDDLGVNRRRMDEVARRFAAER